VLLGGNLEPAPSAGRTGLLASRLLTVSRLARQNQGCEREAMEAAPGGPAALEGESPAQYTKRIRAERNRRHRESVKERALAASPAGKVAAAAAKPTPTRTKAQAPAPGSEPAYLPASVLAQPTFQSYGLLAATTKSVFASV
jgi:hypothetical protein